MTNTPKKITAVAIILNDNDFTMTFTPLLETIKNALEWNQQLTQETVTRAIYKAIEFHYLAFQLGNNYGQRGYGSVEQTITYLISNMKILFNEEAVKDALNVYRDGGAWYLDVASGQITTY
jgi:hypothetical protein